MTFPFPMFMPSLADPTIYEVVGMPAYTTNSSGWGGYTLRTSLTAAAINSLGVGKKYIRASFVAAGNAAYVIANAYIGHRAASGDAYDFEAAPTQLTFGGAAGVTVPANTVRMSDWVPFTVGAGKGLVVSSYSSATSSVFARNVTSTRTGHWRSGSDAATVNASGYTNAGSMYALGIIEASDVAS